MNRPRRLLVEVLEERLAPAVTAADDFYSAPAGAGFTASTVLANDLGSPLTVSAVNGNAAAIGQPFTLPGGSTVTINADGTFLFNANPSAPVAEDFTYTATDLIDSAIATVHITYGDPPPPSTPPTTTDPYYADYLGAVAQADQAYLSSINLSAMSRQSVEDAASASVHSPLNQAKIEYESRMAVAESVFETVDQAALLAYQGLLQQADTSMGNAVAAAQVALADAIGVALADLNQALATTTQAYNQAVQAADSVYQAAVLPFQTARDSTYAFALLHPDDTNAQTAWLQAEQDLAAEIAIATALRDTAIADAAAIRQGDEQQANQTFDTAVNAASQVFEDAAYVAQLDRQTTLESAWTNYVATTDSAFLAKFQAQDTAWSDYQDALAAVDAQLDVADSNSKAQWDTDVDAAANVWLAAERTAWDVYTGALAQQPAAPAPQARRVDLPQVTDDPAKYYFTSRGQNNNPLPPGGEYDGRGYSKARDRRNAAPAEREFGTGGPDSG